MNRPITWQNVAAPTSDPLQGLALAQNSFKNVFAGLGDTLKQYENTADANQKQIRDNNTQAFLDSINKYRTPEEYQAALASGELDAGKYGAQIDRAVARAAMDGRLSVLQDRTVRANQFADQQQEREARPIMDRLGVMALSDDKDLRESAKKALMAYADAGMVPKAAELTGKMRDIDHQDVVWKREATKAEDDLLTNKVARDEKRAHIGYMGVMADAAKIRAQAERDASSSATAELKRELAASKAEKAAAALLISNGPLDAGHMGSYEGKMKFLEGIKKLGVPADEAESVYQKFSTSFGGGVAVDGPADKEGKKTKVSIDLPVSVALSAVEAAGGDSWWPQMLGASSRGERAAKHVTRLMADPAIANGINAAMEAQLIQYRALRNAEENPTVSIKSNSRTTSRSVIPKPSDSMDDSGSTVLSSVMEARKAKAMSMMTPEEIEIAKTTGKMPKAALMVLQGR